MTKKCQNYKIFRHADFIKLGVSINYLSYCEYKLLLILSYREVTLIILH